jgi:hypothetical protein
MKRPIRIGLACLCLSLAHARPAQAQTRCPAIDGGSERLASADAEARLAFVRSTMRDQAARAKTWEWAWSGIGYGLAAGQYALIPIYAPEHRVEEAFEATVSLYLPASIFILPLAVRADDIVLERMIDRASAGSPPSVLSPCRALARAEELFASSAADEALRTGFLQHAVGLVLTAAYTAFDWFVFKYPAGVAVAGGGALVVTEVQILTTPRGAVGALERYKRGDLTLDGAPKVSWSLAPMPGGGGLSVVASF